MPLRKSAAAVFLSIPVLALPVPGPAGNFSLVGDGAFFQQAAATGNARSALLAQPQRLVPQPQPASLPQPGAEDGEGRGAVSLRPGAASLFRGSSTGLFAPVPVAPPNAKQLMALIASAEAGQADYDAVQYGATIRPPKRPTRMTIAEINDWIDATPGQQHAIGRYQLIPATFRRLVKHQGMKPSQRFSPQAQDRLAHQLIEEAGYSAFLNRQMPRRTFMLNLAKIWAGLPTSSGKSYYDGYAGNKASITWAHFEAEMKRIFPS